MPRFLIGDELGNIKSLRYSPGSTHDTKTGLNTLYDRTLTGTPNSVQALSVAYRSSGSFLVASAFSDGSALSFSLGENDALEEVHRWKETRLKDGQQYVGLTVSERGVITCTSNGALRLTHFSENEVTQGSLSSLPTRLCAWRSSPTQETFAYGGDEVDLAVWNTELALSSRSEGLQLSSCTSKKRKRGDNLFPGEIWRAKNIPNDSLGLRQPIRITSLTYLTSDSATHHLLTGTQFGDIRRYDTRTANRPVSEWKVGKVGGIKALEAGIFENEVYVSDSGCNLFALDLRNGHITYGYKGISGTVTSIAPSPSIMASTALDRFARIHSVFPGQQHRKGEVLEKIFTKSLPNIVVWDRDTAVRNTSDADERDEVWEKMKHVGEDDDTE